MRKVTLFNKLTTAILYTNDDETKALIAQESAHDIINVFQAYEHWLTINVIRLGYTNTFDHLITIPNNIPFLTPFHLKIAYLHNNEQFMAKILDQGILPNLDDLCRLSMCTVAMFTDTRVQHLVKKHHLGSLFSVLNKGDFIKIANRFVNMMLALGAHGIYRDCKAKILDLVLGGI